MATVLRIPAYLPEVVWIVLFVYVCLRVYVVDVDVTRI